MILEAAPFVGIALFKQLFLLFKQGFLGSLVGLKEGIARGKEVPEGVPLVKVVLEVFAEVFLHHFSNVFNINTRAGHHTSQVLERLSL